MRRRTWSLVGAVCAALLIAGCTGDPVAPTPDDPDVDVSPDLLIAGTCLASEDPVPDIVDDNAVDCDEPHTHEILASVDIPKGYLYDWDPVEDDYRSLSEAIDGRAENTRAMQFSVWSEVVCEGAMQNRSGLAEVSVGGVSAIDARLVPFATNAIIEPRFQPVDDWLERPKVVCVRELIEPVDGGLSAVPPPSQRELREVSGFSTVDFLTDEEMTAGRVCADRDGNWQACTAPHYAERLFTFSARDVLDEDEFAELSDLRLNEVADAAVAEEEYLGRFVDMCQGTFDGILGLWDADRLTAEIGYGEGWVQDRDVPRIICSVVPAEADEFDLPARSLIGSDAEELELVERP